MSLQNLREDHLYGLLPEGVISLDEQGLIQAVVGGYQDRVDDLRAYTSKLELLVTGKGLPEVDVNNNPTPNAVIVKIQSPQGKVYNRSLEIQDDTPAPGDPTLFAWGTNQLQLDDNHIPLSAAYGVDLSRLVDAGILNYLATTVGAVLYQTAAQDPDNAATDARRLLSTWFPRLQFKGTSESFETLGKLLGFDDVRMTPLWGRLSPRIANDIGDPDNDQDFSALPDFYPKQVRDAFYDPWVLNDGPFFTWTGTATAHFGTNSTSFYTQIVNGFNPFVSVSVVGTAPSDPISAGSPYILVGGGPETKARISPAGSGLLFEAISAGSSFNGLQINFQDISNGTYRVMTIEDRLSAIKYRTSFYDLALTMDFDHAAAQFGTNVTQANKDLINNPNAANFGATALSPFRPWTAGSISQAATDIDFLAEIQANGNTTILVPRKQAGLTSREYDQSAITAAGAQVVQAMEEVRPATRRARHVDVGYLVRDQVGYAEYCAMQPLFAITGTQSFYSGITTPLPQSTVTTMLENVPYLSSVWNSVPGETYQIYAQDFTAVPPITFFLLFQGVATTTTMRAVIPLPWNRWPVIGLRGLTVDPNPTGWVSSTIFQNAPITGEFSLSGTNIVNFRNTDYDTFGTVFTDTGSYVWNFPSGVSSGGTVVATWIPTTTETIRLPNSEIDFIVDSGGSFLIDFADNNIVGIGGVNCLAEAYQARPEDEMDPASLDMPEEYPWRRDLVGGGELIDFDTYSPPALRTPTPQPDIQTVPLGQTVSVVSHTGAQYDVLLVTLGAQPPHFVTQARDLSAYVPGQAAIAYSGTFRDLSVVLPAAGSITASGGLDNVMQPGWQLYHFGLVQGVLVADAPKFFGEHHRTGLVLWLPFNEHPRESLNIIDHSTFDSAPNINGLSPDDRAFDPVQGWYLAAKTGFIATTPINRKIGSTFAGGFWMRAPIGAGVEQTIVTQGPLQVNVQNLDGTFIDINYYLVDASGTPHFTASFGIAAGWNYISWSFDGSLLRVDTWDANGVWNETAGFPPAGLLLSTSTVCSVTAPVYNFDIRDLRLWNTAKTAAQLKLASNHQPTPTACLYRPAYLTAANDYDHYGMRVLPSGFIVPDLLPTSTIANKMAWVQRYDSLGRYRAQDRFKTTGLGSANPLPAKQQLGLQYDQLTAAGTVAVANFSGTTSFASRPVGRLTVSHGTVAVAPYTDTNATSPFFLYGNEETAINVSGTNATNIWANPSLFGLSQTPPVAALTGNGQIAFQVNQTVQPGFYRLRVTSGNIGKVDDTFTGFRVVITVGDVAFQGVLCAGLTGANFTSTDTFEFSIPRLLPGSPSSWLLTFDWSNALKDLRRGTARQLEILGFELTRYNTTLYDVSIGTVAGHLVPTLTPMSVTSADFGTTPGGWLSSVTSWGTSANQAHESTVYSANDTVTSNQPLSNVLASNTVDRHESVRLTTPFLTVDPAIPLMPVYGSIISTLGPYYNPTSTPTSTTSNGYTASTAGTAALPVYAETDNPCKDRKWLRGDDGFIYEIQVATSGTGPSLTATKLFTQSGSEQPTDHQDFLLVGNPPPCPGWPGFAITHQWQSDFASNPSFPNFPTGGFFNGANFSVSDTCQPLAVNTLDIASGTATGVYLGAAGSAILDLSWNGGAAISATDSFMVEVYQDASLLLRISLLLNGNAPFTHQWFGFNFHASGTNSQVQVRLMDFINGFDFPGFTASGTFFCV